MFSLKKLFFTSILVFLFFFPIQSVFSDDFGYKPFYDESKKKRGYKNSSGKLVRPVKFDHAHSFSDGLALVRFHL